MQAECDTARHSGTVMLVLVLHQVVTSLSTKPNPLITSRFINLNKVYDLELGNL
jgi:hypothetical protein